MWGFPQTALRDYEGASSEAAEFHRIHHRMYVCRQALTEEVPR